MRIIRTTDSEIHIVLDTIDIGVDDILPDDVIPGESAGESRIRELEARVKWLEGALTSVLQARRSNPASGEAAMFARTEKLTRIEAAHPLERNARLEAGPESAVPIAPTEPRRPDIDAMNFTADFSTLDDRLREQEELEASVLRQPDLASPVVIDPGMIDRAFARPAPVRIEVRADIEDTYPHLLERIIATWRTPESVRYLRKLIVDERGGRQGFPFEVMSELLILSALLEAPESDRDWGAAATR
jgi:hypothetical protein